MGARKQKWTSEEEAALRAGIARYGVGSWRLILKDDDFRSILSCRSNVDLKDKWRNINVFLTESGSMDKGRTATKKNRAAPRRNDHPMANSTVASDVDDEIVDEQPIASMSSELWNVSIPKKSRSRLNNIILESVKNLNEPTGSHSTTIAKYIEEEYWPPSEFDRILSANLKDLTTSGELIEVNRKYRIAPAPGSMYSEGRSPETLLLEDMQREPQKIESDDIKTLTKSQVDAELADMITMTAEEAASAAARAIAEAEALMAEAEAATREAEAAEADAQAAQAFAEAVRNRNITELIMAQS